MRKAILLLAVACVSGLAAGPRIRENFNANWLFERQSKGAGELGSFDRDTSVAGQVEARFKQAPEPAYDDSEWQSVALPHTWNAHDVTDAKSGYWRGIGWYRKHFQIDPKYRGKRIFVEFEGVNHVAEFWLNGQRLGMHRGGYTSFEFDATAAARFGEDNVLTVKVDNLFHDTVPPTVKTDYNFYGGIYRDVWLRISEPVYVDHVYWATPSVNRQAAELTLDSQVVNRTSSPKSLTLVQEILDPQGRVAKTISNEIQVAAGGSAPLSQNAGTIANPLLWSPDTPNLYKIRTSLKDGATALDMIENPLGFRWFKFDPQKGFFLNGERVQIQGTNWHQSYPGMGNALPNSRHWKDMEQIREMGCNFWRTSHYPHDPATMEASDRLGLMVWEELPINKEIGNPAEYIENAATMAREMIARDRNHPSIVLWGIAGEINAPQSISTRVVAATTKLYKELDPSRPVVMHSPRGDEIESLVDVVGLDVGKETDAKHAKYPTRPYFIGEYSAALMGRGIYGGGRNSEEQACLAHERHLNELNKRPWMAGGCIWNQYDYDGETYDVVIPHVVSFGMTDIWRIPKEVFYFYQSQWVKKPIVHIVGHWSWPGDESKTKTVKVYSNAENVDLYLNGQLLKGEDTKAVYPALAHPPRIWNVPYQPGTLKAVARVNGKEYTDERKTAGPAYKIVLKSDAAKLTSGDPESLAYITASITDKDGNVVPDSSTAISFTLYGPGELVEQTWLGYGTGLTWNVIAGKTVVALRSRPRSGMATVSAWSPGLRMGRLEINVTAPGKPDEMNYKEKFEVDEINR
jgi:beta-galactosidase